jgi:hypothetical protein
MRRRRDLQKPIEGGITKHRKVFRGSFRYTVDAAKGGTAINQFPWSFDRNEDACDN